MKLAEFYGPLANTFDIAEDFIMLHLGYFSEEMEDKIEIQMDVLDPHQVEIIFHELFRYCYDNKLDEQMRMALSCAVSAQMGHEIRKQEEEEEVSPFFQLEPFTLKHPHQHWTLAHWRDAVYHSKTDLSYHDWVMQQMASDEYPKNL